MISLGRSTTSTHILDAKSGRALCGFPNEFREILQVDSFDDIQERDGRLCRTCRSIAETGGRAEPMHLKHKRSQLTELKDALMTGEICYPKFQKAAYPLQKEIEALEIEDTGPEEI